MKKITVDKGLTSFVYISFLLMSLFIAFLALVGYFYNYSTKPFYEYILLVFIALTAVFVLIFLSSVMSIVYAYHKNYVNRIFFWSLKAGLEVLLPFIVSLSIFLKFNKEDIRLFYVRINNIYVQSCGRKYAPEKILILLPHCLQNSECKHRITNDINNCKRCGKCPINDIVKLKEDTGVNIALATGGTAALNIVNKLKPELILAVACGRDLASGIADVRGIPVIGVLNDRPNGPCFNTLVDTGKLRTAIENLTSDREELDIDMAEGHISN